VVATYRNDEVGPRLVQATAELARVGVTPIALRGLSASGTARLMASTWGREVPMELARRVHARTGGNPFFVTEIARLQSADVNAIPDSVRAVIEQRLARLSPLERELLGAAAVVGRDFELRVVAAVLSDAGAERVLGALGRVLEAALVEPDPTSGARYHFKHELIRDAIYEGIEPSRRAGYHAAVLRALERLLPPSIDDHVAKLAAHAAQAELLVGPATVVQYSRLAGEQKLGAHAFEDALPHFERAWRTRNPVPLDAEAAAILAGLGCAQAATALRWNRQEGWDNLRRAVGYYLQVGDVGRAVEAATHPTIVPEAATGVATVIEPMLGAVARGTREEGWLRARLGAALYFETADRTQTRAAFDRAHQVAAAHHDQPLELRTSAYETSVDHFDLKWPDVLAKSRRVMLLARRGSDLHSETYARYRAAFVLTHLGQVADARVEIDANLAAAERLRDRGLLGDALYVASLLALLTGTWKEARAHLERGLTLAPEHLPLLHARVMLDHETGDESALRESLRRLQDVDRRAGPYPLAGVYTAIALAQTLETSRDCSASAGALAAVRTVLGRPVAIPNAVLTVRIAHALVCLHDVQAGDTEEDLDFVSRFESVVPIQWGLANGRLLGLLARAGGHRRRAIARFDEVLGFCRRSGYLP
jgi:tetratricopeptide (TPR) repeat protein